MSPEITAGLLPNAASTFCQSISCEYAGVAETTMASSAATKRIGTSRFAVGSASTACERLQTARIGRCRFKSPVGLEGEGEEACPSMRNLLEKSSVAQGLDRGPSEGEPAFPRPEN